MNRRMPNFGTSLRVLQRLSQSRLQHSPSSLAGGARLTSAARLFNRGLLVQHRTVCTKTQAEQTKSHCQKSQKPPGSLSITAPQFWASTQTWGRAAVNTLRCLVGCTIGDFSAMWFLQLQYPDLGMTATMSISMASGLTTSMLLETVLLRYGKDGLPWVAAAKTAVGMSMISMLTMEMAQNLVDYHLTGGVVQFDSPQFWFAAIIAMGAGFLTPLPYNYLRLRKYGKACH